MKCIICGEEKCESVEHIIPEALGNKKLTTNRVCESCNENIGAKVDWYLTDHPLVKMIRINAGLKGKKGKDIRFFEGIEKDINTGTLIRVRNGKPKIEPRIIPDGIGGIRVEAATFEEGLAHFRKVLKRKGYTDEEIDTYCEDANYVESNHHQELVFQKDASIDFARMDLAAIKIAFEYAHLSFGDEYLEDNVARLFQRELLKAVLSEKKNVLPDNELAKYVTFPISGSGIDILLKEQREMLNSSNVFHTIFFVEQDNCAYCILNLCMTDVTSFAVKVTEDADRYNLNKISIVFGDGKAISF